MNPPRRSPALYLHFEAVQWIVRGYSEPDGYERKAPYELVMNVTKSGGGVGTVFAAHGELNRATYRELCRGLVERGIETALILRGELLRPISTKDPH